MIGHSFGGYVAARAGAASPQVKAIVLIAPGDISTAVKPLSLPQDQLSAAAAAFDDVDCRLGETMSLDLAKEMIATRHDWARAPGGPGLADRPILITGDRDDAGCQGTALSKALASAPGVDVVGGDRLRVAEKRQRRLTVGLAIGHAKMTSLPQAPQ